MNDEIKEKIKAYYVANDIDKLLDYITNLQQENGRKERLITQYGEGMCAYANRIDKAIEELKTANVDIDSVRLCEIIEYAIYILQNGSENSE